MDFFGIGFGELVLILIIALIIVGPVKIVSVAKDLGKMVNNLRKASSEVTAQLTKAVEEEEEKFRTQTRTDQRTTNNQPPESEKISDNKSGS